jgi:hypothetical protein
MMIKKSEWQAAFGELIAARRRELGDPPSEEELLAYSRGELSEPEAARVRELLVCYPELIPVLEPLPSPAAGQPGDADGLSQEELAQDWASLQARLGAQQAGRDAAREGELERSAAGWRVAGPALRRLRRWQLSAAAAALLAVVFAGLLVRTQRDLREPRYDVEHRLLLPDGERGGTQQPIPLPSEAEYFLLIPALVNAPQSPGYRLDIVDLNGQGERVMWSASGLRRRSDDTFELWMPRSFLKPGKYRLVLYGLDGRPVELARYTVRLSPP